MDFLMLSRPWLFPYGTPLVYVTLCVCLGRMCVFVRRTVLRHVMKKMMMMMTPFIIIIVIIISRCRQSVTTLTMSTNAPSRM